MDYTSLLKYSTIELLIKSNSVNNLSNTKLSFDNASIIVHDNFTEIITYDKDYIQSKIINTNTIDSYRLTLK